MSVAGGGKNPDPEYEEIDEVSRIYNNFHRVTKDYSTNNLQLS